MMYAPFGQRSSQEAYQREAVLSATPVRLLTMLYDRLLLDLGRAEVAQTNQDWGTASENLLHAQAIVTELSTSLDVKVWDGADALMGVYNYVSGQLIDANIHRRPESTRECIGILEPLRQSWHEAAALLPAAAPATPPAMAGMAGMASSGGMLGIG
jgi:flagellar secretion chaperone FliS